MRMALIDKSTGQPIRHFGSGPKVVTRVDLPDGSQLSPVILGWENDDCAVVEVTPFTVPEGKQIAGQASYTLTAGKLVETFPVEDIPAKGPTDYPLKRWQFRAMVAYLDKGTAIEGAINAIPDAMERAVAMARYKDSDIYERADPLFDQLAPVVGLTDAEIDAAWMQIATGGV